MSGLSRTVGRRDAAVERTWMYLQRVLESPLIACDLLESQTVRYLIVSLKIISIDHLDVLLAGQLP